MAKAKIASGRRPYFATRLSVCSWPVAVLNLTTHCPRRFNIDPQLVSFRSASTERILGRINLQALRSHHPDKPSGFDVKRIQGRGNLWITEYTIAYKGRSVCVVSIMEFLNGKVVHETQYFSDPFEAPGWRSRWVEQIS